VLGGAVVGAATGPRGRRCGCVRLRVRERVWGARRARLEYALLAARGKSIPAARRRPSLAAERPPRARIRDTPTALVDTASGRMRAWCASGCGFRTFGSVVRWPMWLPAASGAWFAGRYGFGTHGGVVR